MKPEYSIKAFKSQVAWNKWLDKNCASVDGIWVQFYKKASGITTVTYAEALDEALCYGWIDGQTKRYDELSYLQKFTPRRKKSMWSKQNVEHIERLTNAGLMKPSGVAEVERAKQDGRWQAAYDKPSEMVIPDDFLVALKKNKKAHEFFNSLNKTNTYAIAWRLQTAKTEETRKRRQEKILALLEEEKKLV